MNNQEKLEIHRKYEITKGIDILKRYTSDLNYSTYTYNHIRVIEGKSSPGMKKEDFNELYSLGWYLGFNPWKLNGSKVYTWNYEYFC